MALHQVVLEMAVKAMSSLLSVTCCMLLCGVLKLSPEIRKLEPFCDEISMLLGVTPGVTDDLVI